MCLFSVTTTHAYGSEEFERTRTVYKTYRRVYGGDRLLPDSLDLVPDLYATFYYAELHSIDTEYAATREYLIAAEDSQTYMTGFHSYATLTAAQKAVRIYGGVVLECEARGIRAEGAEFSSVIVSRYIKPLREVPDSEGR